MYKYKYIQVKDFRFIIVIFCIAALFFVNNSISVKAMLLIDDSPTPTITETPTETPTPTATDLPMPTVIMGPTSTNIPTNVPVPSATLRKIIKTPTINPSPSITPILGLLSSDILEGMNTTRATTPALFDVVTEPVQSNSENNNTYLFFGLALLSILFMYILWVKRKLKNK